jgi:hypothetical protein
MIIVHCFLMSKECIGEIQCQKLVFLTFFVLGRAYVIKQIKSTTLILL